MLHVAINGLGVDLVIEATGKLRTRDDAARHLKAGARRVLISAPGKGVDATLVPGVNAGTFDPDRHEILSAASCTTNCAAPDGQGAPRTPSVSNAVS